MKQVKPFDYTSENIIETIGIIKEEFINDIGAALKMPETFINNIDITITGETLTINYSFFNKDLFQSYNINDLDNNNIVRIIKAVLFDIVISYINLGC